MIDHIHYQSSYLTASDQWLFGTSRSWKRDKKGKTVNIWRLDLDASGNPQQTNLEVSEMTNGFNNQDHIIAVYPEMISDKMHMIYWTDDKRIWYLEFDFSSTSSNAARLL